MYCFSSTFTLQDLYTQYFVRPCFTWAFLCLSLGARPREFAVKLIHYCHLWNKDSIPIRSFLKFTWRQTRLFATAHLDRVVPTRVCICVAPRLGVSVPKKRGRHESVSGPRQVSKSHVRFVQYSADRKWTGLVCGLSSVVTLDFCYAFQTRVKVHVQDVDPTQKECRQNPPSETN